MGKIDSGRKTPTQVLAGYINRLQDRQDYLHEKIALKKELKRPTGYEEEEFYALRWVLALIASNPSMAIGHLSEDLRKRTESKTSNKENTHYEK